MNKASKPLPSRKKDMPATIGFVDEVRYELKSEIKALGHEMGAQFKQVDSQFKQIDAQFHGLRAEIQKSHTIAEETRASVHRMQALAEQQYSENRLVLEQLSDLWRRQGRVEKRQDDTELFLKTLKPYSGKIGKES